ncbi:LysR family transcriptional regulator [Amycolatopsis taiwanensis]|uniref:LysR family transcriptional regulator n=2 Tax=Amycolatopsis taiwanensis TaxID=342230 RepID=A0A9W6VIB3_9PSEU|nr:LysR family transcriptional regulator [Amycolatopsis taiwanensis]
MFSGHIIDVVYMSDFDLNLVRTFVLLYETRSVTATAESMHLTQPTVSYGLQKLRRRFDDELFRRTGAGLIPTTTASELYQPLCAALAGIEGIVSRSDAFDAATARTGFTIALSDLGEVALLPRLLTRLRTDAPGSTLTVRPLDVEGAEAQLGRGEIDAFIASPLICSQRLARIPLFSESYVGMVGQEHPRLRGNPVTEADLAAEEHVTVFGPNGHHGPRRALNAHGMNVALEVTRFSSLPYLLRGGELVAMAPRKVAEVFADTQPVRLFEVPFEIESVEVSIYARHPHARSSAQRWLVEFMHRVLAERK